ncbi:MAG: MerR family transcriptional regulator [Armatimonadetes bacterium]|nr:MerR family transcriptional regulator [Armatimonadota bacterium]MBX3107654.1 MerR family transcriptional regulator [Fimbriimonadaceae bacterium]
MERLYTIGEVASQLGVTTHMLRYYERAGLLHAVQRTAGNARRYPSAAIDLIRLLRKLRETGMPIARMREYVDLIADGPATIEARQELLRAHRESLCSQIDALEHCKALVDAKLDVYHAGCSMEDTGHPAVRKLTQLLLGTKP